MPTPAELPGSIKALLLHDDQRRESPSPSNAVGKCWRDVMFCVAAAVLSGPVWSRLSPGGFNDPRAP